MTWRRRILVCSAVFGILLAAGGGAFAASGLRRAPAAKSPQRLAPALSVVSVSPAAGSTGAEGTQAIEVTFSAPLSARSPLPAIAPAVQGSWERVGAATLRFVPDGAFLPGSTVTLRVPGGPHGVLAADGARLGAPVVDTYQVGDGSTVRLQQLLSLLGYSPLAWSPSGPPLAPGDLAVQAEAAFSPPAGSFSWRQGGWPASLVSRWEAGAYGPMTRGMVMAFEADHGLPVDGVAGTRVWAAMFQALAAGQVSTQGYTYALVSKTLPETMTLWHNGTVVLRSVVDTGIAAAPTPDGAFPVYERLRSQVMKGTNPDGARYADPVQYVAYFNGGDAVHYIARAAYGFPQSLGCVELPLAQAAQAWPYLAIGSLVEVTG